MSAEPEPPDPLPLKGLTADKDIKGSKIQHRQQERKHQGPASGQRSCFLGLETKPELVWEDWEPGGEFTETLVLKNTHNKLKKLQIRCPVSMFFSTLIPQKITISPGLSFSIPVTFRPLQMCEYEDNIEFQYKEGSFQVSLRAIVPCHTLEVPESVILPHCAVQHSSRANFLLKNVSKLSTSFQWDCAAPFQLNPQTGILKPGQENYIEVVFQPQEALVYQQQASCRFGGEEKTDQCCAVLLKGLAKNPYLELRNYSGKKEEDQRNPVLDFGSVVIGQSLCKHFDILNPSPVNVSFSVSQLPNMVPGLSSVFRFDVTKDKVAPGGSVQASVTYSPTVVDAVSVDYLSLKYGGALKKTHLKLTGKCIGPVVCLSSSLVDFGCVKEGGFVDQKLNLINSSPAEAFYQWDIDGSNSVFSIQPASGTVLPHSSTKLTAVYRPMQPNAHHRRVACLILHRDPLFLDMIGTCHTELHKPPILKPEHLVLDKLQWYHRQHLQSSVSALQQSDHTHLDQEETLQDSTAEQLNQTPKSAARSIDESSEACMEYLNLLSSSSSLSSSPVSIVPKELLFNHKKATSFAPSSAFVQSVTIENHTRQDVRLVWTVTANSPFAVSPSLCDLPSDASTSFRILYGSKQLNTLHGAQLECFAYCKDDTHPGEQLVCPPWCMTVRVIAHSFQRGKEHFTPHCSLKPTQVVFPTPGASSYQTVLLQNNGDLPLTFCLDHRFNNSSTKSVCILPTCGFIQPGHHQIFILRAIPAEDSPKEGLNLSLQLNAAQFTRVLTVFSVAEKQCVSLESGSSLYFHPTAVSSESRRTHHIRNLGCLPVRFQWSIPEKFQQVIFVKPDAGELHPNDTSIQTWSFCPLAEETYRIKPTLTFWSNESDGSDKTHLFLEVFGIGSKGSLEAEKAVVDAGEIPVGSYHTVEVALVNSSSCPVSFSLSVEQILTDDSEAEQCELKLDCERGTIASRSKIHLQSTCRPGRHAQYIWTISYQTLNASGSTLYPPKALCEVRAKGVFPTLQVIDSCVSGSVGMLSKGLLWKLFSLHSLNEHLLSTPTDVDLTFPRLTRHRLQRCPSILTKAILDFNFGSAHLNSDPSDFVLTFYNPGLIPVNWAFLFPKDQQIDLEYWAMRGEFSSVELDYMKRQDNHIFRISPRSGTLLPGHRTAVRFSYRHVFVGTNRLPIIFRLSYGREILLKFQGVTVERNKPCVLFASTQHVFTSVFIGDCRPPRQMYELHNGGAVPVHYEVDADVLSQLRMNNFEHPVLHCLNPEGDILPGKTAMLEWIFCPLEAETYHMDVPIHIQNTDSTLVRFEGCGLGTLMPGSSMTITHGDCKGSERHVQRTPLQGQVLFLSEDSIFIGDIPVYTQSSRILFITNVSHTHTAHYMWDLQSNEQVVQIHPDRGRLRPGECALCNVTFTPANYPTIYQLDLICQVTLEAALVQYQNSLQNWEEEQKSQQNIITDKNVPEIQEVDKEPFATPARNRPSFSKYKILPPICASSDRKPLDNLYAEQTRAEEKVVSCPQPPKPALLHLTVSAHTHEFMDFVKKFPEKNIKQYRYHQPVNTQRPASTIAFTRLPAGPTVSTQDSKRQVIESILTTMLWEIFDDPDFIQTLVTLASKPRPYQPRELSSTHSPNIPSPLCLPTSLIPSPPSTPQPHVPLSETMHTEGATGGLENRFQTRRPVHIPADICEDILQNTLHNVMMEAVRGEFDLTSYPRTHHPDN